MSRHLVRSIRNIPHSGLEVKLRDLTSNDPYGPSGTDLNEVATLTFKLDKLKEVVKLLNKRISPKKNTALQILKSLTIIQYCLQVGSLEFVSYYRVHWELIDRLRDYDYLNKRDSNVVNVRKRSRYVLKLIRDDSLLASKRENFHKLRSEMLIPGIKSSSLDKTTRMRYSLDQSSNDLKEEEQPVLVPRARSLDVRRTSSLHRSKVTGNSGEVRRTSSLHHRNGGGEKPAALQFITEEIIDDGDLNSKIDLLTNNPFRSSVFVDNYEGLTSDSGESLSSDSERKNTNPFLINTS